MFRDGWAVCEMLCTYDLCLGNRLSELETTIQQLQAQCSLTTHMDSHLTMMPLRSKLQKFIGDPAIHVETILHSSADIIIRRYRKMVEVDPLSIADLDQMSVESLDYVTVT